VTQRTNLAGDLTVDLVERALHALACQVDQLVHVVASLSVVTSRAAEIDRDRFGNADVRDTRPIRRRQEVV
jgi:hypothetical protein